MYLPSLRWEQEDHQREDAASEGNMWKGPRTHCVKHIEEKCFDFFKKPSDKDAIHKDYMLNT